jgi:hypothetical protein
MVTDGCGTDTATSCRLDNEQRARVTVCLRKEALSLPPDRLEQFISGIEASIAHFRATPPEASFRDAHDALRALRTLAHEDDPPIGQLKARLARLPPEARASIGRRAPTVMRRLGFDLGSPAGELPEHAFNRFLRWTTTPEAVQLPEPPPPLPKALAEKLAALAGAEPVSLPPLVTTLRVLSSHGARPVEGRSRGGGKRSAPRLEPMIMGEVRGAGTARHRGGRPTNERDQTLVMHLALDWLTATCKSPKRRRSDKTGFGDLVHSVFQWLSSPEGTATYALRKYWAAAKAFEAREPLEDFLRRHGEEL